MIDTILTQLAAVITDHPTICFFNPPSNETEIARVEEHLNITLPPSYKQFLLRFNGGFITPDWPSTAEHWTREDAAYNCNHLLSLSELMAAYIDMRDIETLDRGWKGTWPYVPFCHTEGQEYLVFDVSNSGSSEAPVRDAFHEVSPDEWGDLYQNFADLLQDYVAQLGRIKLVGG